MTFGPICSGGGIVLQAGMAPHISLLVRHPAFLPMHPETGGVALGTVIYGFNGSGARSPYSYQQL